MWRLAILTLATALTAAHGSYAPSSWEKMLAVLMQNTDTDTTVKADTGKCGKLCYVRIPETVDTPEAIHVLKVGKAIVDPLNECNRYFCEESGVSEKAITCPNDNKLCENGKARIKLPGKCCKVCNPPNGKGGKFTEWQEWTQCSVTCGGGIRARRRRCQLNEDGIFDNCHGETFQIGNCSTRPCPVNCEWKWSSYSECSVSCGGGTQIRYPIITIDGNHGGRPCPLRVQRNDTESKSCSENGCKVNCKWLEWNQWTVCSKTCGGGTTTRSRGKVPAQNGGKECEGKSSETKACNTKPCDVDCRWLAWSQWSSCSKTCDGGKQSRERGKIPAQYDGKKCEGASREERGCNKDKCPCTKAGQTKCDGICIDDRDGDCVPDRRDNCKDIKNKNQKDQDRDKVGDVCDNCVYAPNRKQENADNDATGDACDEDDDNDGRVDINDNCPKVYNPDQKDSDRDGYGDVCEPSVEEAVSQEKNMSPKEKTIAAEIMEKLLEMYYSSK